MMQKKSNLKYAPPRVFSPCKNRGRKIKKQGCWNWQTSRPQTPVFLTCGFKSRPLHQKILQKRIRFLQYFFIQVADLAYHHALACISSALWAVYHHRRCIPLRLDDIQNFVLMICNFYEIDDIQGYRLDFEVRM